MFSQFMERLLGFEYTKVDNDVYIYKNAMDDGTYCQEILLMYDGNYLAMHHDPI